ncbi:MAG TPA: hypothetical protein VFF65_04415 [Phycisphaerales bacterium]|nr:hypothetical protein [Phycisphaerales bacterium]
MSTDGPIPAPIAAATSTGTAGPAFRKPLLDAGWLLLIPGIALVGFTLIVPAIDDLDAARFYRDRLSLVEQHRDQRIGHYTQYLQAVQSGDPQTIRSLAAVSLNKVPESDEGMALMVPAGDIARKSASVFEALEPPAPALPQRQKDFSTLERLSRDPKSRVWLLIAGATLIFLGILPASRS